MKPARIQLKRTRGWKMPPNTVIVDRRTKWGNPFPLQKKTFEGEVVPILIAQQCSVANFRNWVDRTLWREAQVELRGKNLACWCSLDSPCHADVLLEIANSNDLEKERPRHVEKTK